MLTVPSVSLQHRFTQCLVGQRIEPQTPRVRNCHDAFRTLRGNSPLVAEGLKIRSSEVTRALQFPVLRSVPTRESAQINSSTVTARFVVSQAQVLLGSHQPVYYRE